MLPKMGGKGIPPITPERWLSNLLEATSQIADKEYQERRWLALDARVWECPDELINAFDDCVFDGFIEQYGPTFTKEQRAAALGFRDELNSYCQATDRHLDPAEVLVDPRWAAVRQKAATFIVAFRGK
jgi:hypothetical protein